MDVAKNQDYHKQIEEIVTCIKEEISPKGFDEKIYDKTLRLGFPPYGWKLFRKEIAESPRTLKWEDFTITFKSYSDKKIGNLIIFGDTIFTNLISETSSYDPNAKINLERIAVKIANKKDILFEMKTKQYTRGHDQTYSLTHRFYCPTFHSLSRGPLELIVSISKNVISAQQTFCEVLEDIKEKKRIDTAKLIQEQMHLHNVK